MTDTFADYARYYNLLYQDKDYAGETDFVLAILAKHGCVPAALLDIGCGTGRHALEMTRRGVEVAGVDMSATMLAMGREMIDGLNPADFPAPLPVLHYGDARAVRLGNLFDAATSLFHVMSYQNTEEDALSAMATARAHLKPGGLFLFDFWHGPGVLADPPAAREKRMEDAATRITRKAVPLHRAHDKIVDVHYAVTLMDKETGRVTSLAEKHSMRYWFVPELRHLAKTAGLKVVADGGWAHEHEAGCRDWNAWLLVAGPT